MQVNDPAAAISALKKLIRFRKREALLISQGVIDPEPQDLATAKHWMINFGILVSIEDDPTTPEELLTISNREEICLTSSSKWPVHSLAMATTIMEERNRINPA